MIPVARRRCPLLQRASRKAMDGAVLGESDTGRTVRDRVCPFAAASLERALTGMARASKPET